MHSVRYHSWRKPRRCHRRSHVHNSSTFLLSSNVKQSPHVHSVLPLRANRFLLPEGEWYRTECIMYRQRTTFYKKPRPTEIQLSVNAALATALLSSVLGCSVHYLTKRCPLPDETAREKNERVGPADKRKACGIRFQMRGSHKADSDAVNQTDNETRGAVRYRMKQSVRERTCGACRQAQQDVVSATR